LKGDPEWPRKHGVSFLQQSNIEYEGQRYELACDDLMLQTSDQRFEGTFQKKEGAEREE
jgi:hypothetical protein